MAATGPLATLARIRTLADRTRDGAQTVWWAYIRQLVQAVRAEPRLQQALRPIEAWPPLLDPSQAPTDPKEWAQRAFATLELGVDDKAPPGSRPAQLRSGQAVDPAKWDRYYRAENHELYVQPIVDWLTQQWEPIWLAEAVASNGERELGAEAWRDVPRLVRLEVAGYRSLASVSLGLGPVNVLIGPNGAGKSNLLSLFRLLSAVPRHSVRKVVATAGGATTQLHRGPKVTPRLQLRAEFGSDGTRSAWTATLEHAAGDALVFVDERVETQAASSTWNPVSLGSGHAETRLDPTRSAVEGGVVGGLAGIAAFHFHDTSRHAPIRSPSRVEDAARLQPDGANLAAFLHALGRSPREDDRLARARIVDALLEVAPFVKDVRPTPTETDGMVRLDWVDAQDEVFGVHQLSDGTLRFLALATALLQPADRLPALVAIDEPELGLHPAAIALLASIVRSVSHRCTVVLATQAPQLLDAFEPDEVVVVEHALGGTQLTRLSADGLRDWLEEYTLAELYDKNVLGGRP